MNEKKRYREVPQMVRELSESRDFADAFEKRLGQRELIKNLLIFRAAQGLSQKDIAQKIGCTQSKISKLESGVDGDIRLADLLKYVSALGLRPQVLFFKKGVTVADEVKFHFFETKSLMEKLAGLANVDPVIAKGIASFFNEACANFMTMMIENAKSLPETVHEDIPLIRLVSEHTERVSETENSGKESGFIAVETC